MKAKRGHSSSDQRKVSETMNVLAGYRKWSDPILPITLLLPVAMFLGYLYWQTTGIAQDLEAQRADTNSGIGELEDELATAIAERDTAIQERNDALAQLDDAIANRITVYGSQTLAEQVQPNTIQGTTPIGRNVLLLLLRGERKDFIGRPDIYQSIGTITIPPGNWAFAEKGIGGDDRTGAGNSQFFWEAVPDICIEQPTGSWYDAIRATCEVNIEWTVNSRYPHSILYILPIDEFIPQEGE